MFGHMDDDVHSQSSLDESIIKRRKYESYYLLHSSLDHHSVRVPSTVEYPSIDQYYGEHNKTLLALENLEEGSSQNVIHDKSVSVGSPIVLKTPKQKKKLTLGNNFVPPYSFFSVKELSLVKSLKHWHSSKVCAVGKVIYDHETQQPYLQSRAEGGIWSVMMDISLLKLVPPPNTSVQCFGNMEMAEALASLKINFFRLLNITDLRLFTESYKLMENFTHIYTSSSSTKIITDEIGDSENNQ